MNTRLNQSLDNILSWMERKQEVRRRDYWERRLIRRVNTAFGDQSAQLLRILGDPPRMENISESFWEGAGESFTRQVKPVLEEVFMQQAADMIRSVPFGVDWALVNSGAVSWARDYAFDLVSKIDDTSRSALQEIFSNAFEQDWTRREIEAAIPKVFGPVRSEMIAITEVTRASNEGTTAIRNELSRQGIEMNSIWHTRNDEFVCPICGPLDGEKADHYDSDGNPVWIHPETGEEVEHTPHPRCRCSYGLEIPDE